MLGKPGRRGKCLRVFHRIGGLLLAAGAATLTIAAPAAERTPALEKAVASARFQWSSTAPVILPKSDANHQLAAVKDPSIVYANGKYHVFMTTAGPQGWGLAYTSFRTWQEAPTAPLTFLDKSGIGPGYRAAPQVFFFAPQKRWYMVFQGGDPFYSTTMTIDDPLSWSAPQNFFQCESRRTAMVM